MRYQELFEDFENIRQTQSYSVGLVIDECQKYVEYLEGKEDMLESLIAFINEASESNEIATKEMMLEGLKQILVYE